MYLTEHGDCENGNNDELTDQFSNAFIVFLYKYFYIL